MSFAALDEARACEGSANQGGTTVDLYPFVPGLWPGAKGFFVIRTVSYRGDGILGLASWRSRSRRRQCVRCQMNRGVDTAGMGYRGTGPQRHSGHGDRPQAIEKTKEVSKR